MQGTSHWIERKIVAHMKEAGELTIPDMAVGAGLGEDQARRGIQWLIDKGMVRASPQKYAIKLGEAGIQAHKYGLPERRLLDMLQNGSDPDSIYDMMGNEMAPAVGVCARNGWIRMLGRRPVLVSHQPQILGETVLDRLARGDAVQPEDPDVTYFKGRPGYIQKVRTEPSYSLTEVGKHAGEHSAMDLEAPTAGEHSAMDLEAPTAGEHSAMDLEAPTADVYIARTHPLYDTISEVREAFISLGFDEVVGNMVQSSFWNFDALFTPQDHPAREMQDTFFVDDTGMEIESSGDTIEAVARTHKECWGGGWDMGRAAEPVLRTHNTCVTIRHLAENDPEDARVFSLGRVFRNEKPSYKHLAEFNQAEGVVIGEGVSLRDLMGIQREFYKMMGMKRVKFWPTYFPYTEPSLQSMVYNETLGKWIELFGMGIFRPEVTKPLGISRPVLAWGGGIERMAMIKYGLDDVRTLYQSKMGWLRRLPLCP